MNKRVIVENYSDSENETRVIVDKVSEEMIVEEEKPKEEFYYLNENEKLLIQLLKIKTETSTCESKECYICYLYNHRDEK